MFMTGTLVSGVVIIQVKLNLMDVDTISPPAMMDLLRGLLNEGGEVGRAALPPFFRHRSPPEWRGLQVL